MLLEGVDAPSAQLAEALEVFGGALDRLDHEDRVRDAERDRERRDARR